MTEGLFRTTPRPGPLHLARKRLYLRRKVWRLARREREFRRLVAGGRIEHVSGPPHPRSSADLVVVTPVLDGAYWLPSFMRHYRSLGDVHFVFLDNGSRDESREIVRREPSVTLLQTSLPFAPYQISMRRWLVRRFGKGRWTLMADTDELFDFPGSERIGLRGFLGYLDGQGYNAVLAHVLEMFGEGPLDGSDDGARADLKSEYPLYDLGMLSRHPRAHWLLDRSTPEHLLPITGGTRERVFGQRPMLSKHSLVRWAGDFRLLPINAHFSYDAALADVAGVVLHYKFTRRLLRQATAVASGRRKVGNTGSATSYRRVLAGEGEIELAGDDTHRYAGAERLVEQGFLFSSPAYSRHVEGYGSDAPSP